MRGFQNGDFFPLEINTHDSVKNEPKFENKGLFHEKYFGA